MASIIRSRCDCRRSQLRGLLRPLDTPSWETMGRKMAEEQSEASKVSETRQELAAERSLVRRLSRAIRFADFMAALMVAATAFSALATWRTASIAKAIYLASERAYVGVEGVWIDGTRSDDPRVEVDFRNFGNVAAQEVKLTRRLKLDGVVVKDSAQILNAGILSPTTPHRLHLHLPANSYTAVTSGKATLTVEIAASFFSAQRQLCYLQRFTYVEHENEFLVDGGTTDCTAEAAFEQEVAIALPPAGS
jgi:hypothetical protein